MGNTFEVYTYKIQDSGEYAYEEVYRGESYQEAIKAMKLEKRKGGKCVKLEWR